MEVHLMGGHLMGGHLIGVHLIGGHLWAGILEARILWAWASRAEIATLILPPGPHPGIPLCWVAYGGVLWWPRMVPSIFYRILPILFSISFSVPFLVSFLFYFLFYFYFYLLQFSWDISSVLARQHLFLGPGLR
jgi:hypothetical protein